MFTKIECGECGGDYRHDTTATVAPFVCVECGHAISGHDIVLDEGETLIIGTGPLGYITEEVA